MTRRLVLPFLFLATAAFAQAPLNVDALIQGADRYDGKVVVVRGTIEQFRQRKSRAGNDYVTAVIKGQKSTANVYVRGKMDPEPKKRDRVEVMGIFRKEKKLQGFSVKNEIDAGVDRKDDTTKNFGMKILKDGKS